MKKVVIIGGMAAGCKAAARLKRLEPETQVTVIEKKGFISYGACGMPLFASGDVEGFLDLAKTPWGTVRDPEFFKKVKGVDVEVNTEAVSIDHEKKVVHCRNLENNAEKDYQYDHLVIATGASAVMPPIPMPESERISTFHNPLDAKRFRQKAQTGQVGSAVIIGGGYIGCELAEALVSLWGIETTLIEKEDRLLPACMDKEMSRFLENTFSDNDINLKLSTGVKKIDEDSDGNLVTTTSGGDKITTDYVFVCTGVKPNVDLAKSIGVETGGTGAIRTDRNLMTNIPGVYAAGDCIEINNFVTGRPSFIPLGSLANRQGRVIADNISGRKSVFKGSAATISMKVFEFITANSGITEQKAKDLGLDYACVWGTWLDRPDYHPDHKNLFGKLVYEKNTMRLLGLQLTGKGEVTRYIDVFSDMLARKATYMGLIDFEHAYNPPHSGPVNPLNSLGAMAENQEEFNVRCINPLMLDSFDGQVLDVREKVETEAVNPPEKAMKILLSEYKEKLDELDKGQPLLVICQKGPRSYEAARCLAGAGFSDVCYLGGGLTFNKVLLDDDIG